MNSKAPQQPTTDASGSPIKAYEVAQHYWTHQRDALPELFGVADIGGSGLTEVLYRHHEELRHLRRIVAFGPRQTVLEIGSGNGRWAISLAPSVSRYVAVDFSRQMLDVARQRAAEAGLENIVFCESAAQSYMPTMNFDVVYFSGVSQYIRDDDLKRLLERLMPFVKPGGVVVDRSTIHRRQRLVSERTDYFSIYRTADELVHLFDAVGWANYYRQPSYLFLNFPGAIQWLLSRRKCARLVGATAPLSFHLLRAMACVGSLLFKPTGVVLDFSHVFSLFRRKDEHDVEV